MQHPRLIYVMGASGVGKDSLLDYLRSHPQRDIPLCVAQRSITRPQGGNEQHIPISEDQFQRCVDNKEFALHWSSHGYRYGIDRETLTALVEGKHVLVNGSREYLPEAIKRIPQLLPVLMVAKPEQIRQRLIRRGRESASAIRARVQREIPVSSPDLVVIDNNGPLALAARQLLDVLAALEPHPLQKPA